ncbi:MAG: dynamin family protein [Bdellovibrionota bacterium]
MQNEEYKNNYIESLRLELIQLVENELTPAAQKYGYSDTPLQSNIKWKPMVLILGNYSSGKSTLINEFLQGQIQETGQAPTDDSFTVITCDDIATQSAILETRKFGESGVCVQEIRDGKVLLNDPQYPFESLCKQGDRFVSHFKLKKVNAPFLKNLALIDTPGMLDSIAERDRGYDYQQVIGDLAQIADLILILFDPHKAGTVQETYHSLRETLPTKTFEDRVVFVLNRIDECRNLPDLIKVYGTLCWNLSQMTGRKDIPKILMTYSPSVRESSATGEQSFLRLLDNQREELRQLVLKAPRNRLDNLASFVETHSARLAHLLEGVYEFAKRLRNMKLKFALFGLIASLFAGASLSFYFSGAEFASQMSREVAVGIAGGISIIAYVVWIFLVNRTIDFIVRPRLLKQLDTLTELDSQARLDTWSAVSEILEKYLKNVDNLPSVSVLKKEFESVRRVYVKGSKEIRTAINEMPSKHSTPTL